MTRHSGISSPLSPPPSTASSILPTPSWSSNCARICAATVSAHGVDGKSRSAQNVRANCSGVTSDSCKFHTKQSRIRCVSVSNSTRIGTSATDRFACSASFSSALCTRLSECGTTIKLTWDVQIYVLRRRKRFRDDEPRGRYQTQITLVQLRPGESSSSRSRRRRRYGCTASGIRRGTINNSEGSSARGANSGACPATGYEIRSVRVDLSRIRNIVSGSRIRITDYATASRARRCSHR